MVSGFSALRRFWTQVAGLIDKKKLMNIERSMLDVHY